MKIFKAVLLLSFTLIISFSVSAQDCAVLPPCTGDPWEIPSGPSQNCCTNVTVPFDGGISLLLAAGLGIGVRSAYKRKKQAVKL